MSELPRKCRVGDTAVFIPPAEPHLVGRFVRVVADEPLASHLLREQVWSVRLLAGTVPCACTGKPISAGVTFDCCLQPVRPGLTEQSSPRAARIPETVA